MEVVFLAKSTILLEYLQRITSSVGVLRITQKDCLDFDSSGFRLFKVGGEMVQLPHGTEIIKRNRNSDELDVVLRCESEIKSMIVRTGEENPVSWINKGSTELGDDGQEACTCH